MNFDMRSGLLVSTAVMALAALSGQAVADTTVELETVTVTASKTTERQIDVALPVTAMDTSTLLATNSVHLEDYALRIPGISVTSQGNGRASAIIRGISSGLSNNPTVGITIDDVPIGSSTSAGLGDSILPDLDPGVLSSIEVLRGPQGSLYGASSMGGLIRYVTSAPDLSRTYGQLGVSSVASAHGNEGYGVRGFANTPLIDGVLAVQASSFYRFDPGYVDNIRDGHKDANLARTAGGRLAILWQITPKVSYELSGIIESRKSGYSSRVDVSFDRKPLNGTYYASNRIPGTNGGHMELGIYSGTLKADLDFADFAAITAYSRSAFNGPQDASASFDKYLKYFYDPITEVPHLNSRIDNYAQTGKFSQEARLSSKPGSTLEWMFGLFMTRETSLSDQDIFATKSATGARYDDGDLYTVHDPESYNEYAAFGSATYHFSPAFDLQLGARIAAQKQFFSDYVGGWMGDGDTNVGTQSANVFTWSITPRYHISDNMMVYGRVATGYRPGGVNTAPGLNPSLKTFGSDRTVNYEVGFKGIVIDGLLMVDASLFDIEWNKIQLQAADANNFSFVQNGGAARSQGFELATTLTPGLGWTVAANFSFVEATLQKDVNVSSLYGLQGQRLPYSSKTAGSLSVDKSFAVTTDVTADLGGTFNYQGSRYAAFPTKSTYARFFMPAYGTLDLTASLEYQDWKLSLYTKNVFDQVGFTYGQSRNVATLSGDYDAAIIAPRTVGLSLTKNF
jgi:iron complex outermembrane recepter protein